MTQKSTRKPARKAAAKKAARPKAAKAKAPVPRKTAKPRKPSPKPAAKKAAARKPAPRKPASPKPAPRKTRARKADSATPPSIEQASAVAGQTTPAPETIPETSGEIRLDPAALKALDLALTGGATAEGTAPQAPLADPAQAASRRAGTEEAGPDSGPDSGPESDEEPARINKLMPTNAVHPTKRRAKRNTWQGPTLAFGAMAAVLAIVVLGQDSAPPDVSPLEQRASALLSDSPDVAELGIQTARRPEMPNWYRESKTAAETDAASSLRVLELVELERMLQRLEMGPSKPDGIVDAQTESAIRMYQQIAGLPVDGAPSRGLLNDMREVVKMLDQAE